MKDKILKWFCEGEVGLSSKAMARASINMLSDRSYPLDPADFNRCLMLLDCVPEIRDHMDKIRGISERWALLVDRWDDVESMFLDEVGLNWCNGHRAPKTYELMKAIRC